MTKPIATTSGGPAKDEWGRQGAYTEILARNPRVGVFYIEDDAKLIDTNAVIRSSGRGCDASNLFDEEVMDAKEMYFSDDEQEREYKNRGKKNKKKNKLGKKGNGDVRHDRNTARGRGQPRPTHNNIPGFYRQQPQQQRHYGHGNVGAWQAPPDQQPYGVQYQNQVLPVGGVPYLSHPVQPQYPP